MSYQYYPATSVRVDDDDVTYTEDEVTANYEYRTTLVTSASQEGQQGAEDVQQQASTNQSAGASGGSSTRPKLVIRCKPNKTKVQFKTKLQPRRTGVMMVGWGGNNGTTVTAGIMANRRSLSWRNKDGEVRSNYYGSVTQSSTVRLGTSVVANESLGSEGAASSASAAAAAAAAAAPGADSSGAGAESTMNDVFVPLNALVPMVHPDNLILGGWDISSMNLGDAMKRAKVLDVQLQDQLYEDMKQLVPLPSIYSPDFIAANQSTRADNVIKGTKKEQLETLRGHIRDFKQRNNLDTCIIMWTANTERFAEIQEGVNDTADNLLASIDETGTSEEEPDHDADEEDLEISPSTIFAVASILEGCPYINGSPQNTFVPGVIELAAQKGVYIGGDDFKSGQTKMKSVLVDFLVSAGIKPTSIVSYNHLGNNDGKNLSAPKQFRSKEISKSNVVDDMVASNGMLYQPGEHPDHVVVIKYVPYVGDSKRAMDEYTSEIFMGGTNTIVMHNTCEDSLLAAPLILDLVILTELFDRISFRIESNDPDGAATPTEFQGFHSVLSLLSFLIKAPLTPPGAPVVNALFAQREAIVNFLRAVVGLPPENFMLFEHRVKSGVHVLPNSFT